MYEKDKKQRITLRLNQKQFDFIRKSSESLGIAPSDFIRMLVNSYIYASESQFDSNARKTSQAFEELKGEVVNIIEKKGLKTEDLGRENDETPKHDII